MPPSPEEPVPHTAVKMTACDLEWDEENDYYYTDFKRINGKCETVVARPFRLKAAEPPKVSITTICPTLYIVKAVVSGFATEKKEGEILESDISYVIEVTWSDGRTHAIKRTFTDFCNFHYALVEEYARSCANITDEESPLKLAVHLPDRSNESQERILLAENRELQLNKYVQELVHMPAKVSASPAVLTFFESRTSDPKPYTEPKARSGMKITDHYIICWL